MSNDLVDAFMQAADQARRHSPSPPSPPRLIFALDATASRQPTWDMASSLTKQMFDAVHRLGGLDVQLLYFRGYGPPVAGPFVDDARRLTAAMSAIQCLSGLTQIGKSLDHIRRESARQRVSAFVYIGDACEEPPEDIARKAATLGGPKGFVFHEDPAANRAAAGPLKAIATGTKGVYLPFDSASIDKIGELLAGIAAYAAGGTDALLARNDEASRLLLGHLKN